MSLKFSEANPVALELISYSQLISPTFNDTSSWPTSPDGTGSTLVRVLPALYGSDPASWQASINPGGTSGVFNSAPSNDWRTADFSEAEFLDATISGPTARNLLLGWCFDKWLQ